MFGWLKYQLFSDNKAIYRSIARQCGSSAVHVYNLAHGKKAKSTRDYKIPKRLHAENIIFGIQYVH